jgi:hypothetical protein
MDAVQSMIPEGSGLVMKLIFFIVALLALYYLYQFLFSPSGMVGTNVLNKIVAANPDKAIVIPGAQLPAIYAGGEMTINGWIYINDYSINRGLNKPIFTLGGSTFLTLAVFLGAYKSSLGVRVHTREGGATAVMTAETAGGPGIGQPSDDLSLRGLSAMFGNLQQEGGLLSESRPCDIDSIDLQKWVQLTICLNNKTVDVFVDGKLARSCVLPTFYKVDTSGFALNVCDFKGFGGFVSNVSVYNYALNPEQVWRLYMSGPGPQYGLLDYVKSLFDPSAVGSFDYPKQNITQ